MTFCHFSAKLNHKMNFMREIRVLEEIHKTKKGSSGINVGQTEEAEALYLYADAPHTQIVRPNRRGYNARANDLNLPILWLDF